MLALAALFGMCWFGLCTTSEGMPGGTPPGVVIRLSASGLTMLSELANKYFMADYLREIKLGVIDTKNCPFDACSLQHFTIRKFVPPKSNVTIIRGIGIEWNLREASLDLSFDYELQMVDESLKGFAQVSLSKISFAATITLGRGPGDNLEVLLMQCSADIGQRYSDLIDETPNDYSDYLATVYYEVIRRYLENTVYESVSEAICKMADIVTDVIPEDLSWMDEELRWLGLTVDGRLVRDPVVNEDYVEVALSGEVRLLDGKEGASFQPPNLDLPSAEHAMVAVYVSLYPINTLADALFKSNRLSVNVTKNDLPVGYRNLLDTTCEGVCLGTVFPEFADKYPNVSATLVIASTTRPSLSPAMSIDHPWTSVRLSAEFDFSIIIPGENDSEASVSKLSLSFSIEGTGFTSGDRVEGRVESPRVLITDKGSPKEFVSHLPRFKQVLQMIADYAVVPLLNYAGAVGIPLGNLYGLRFVRHELNLRPDFLAFSSDIVDDTLSK